MCIYIKWSEVKSLSRVRLFATPWTVAYWAPPSLGFSRQEYWSGYFLLQGNFLTQELKPGLPHCRQTLYRLSHKGSHIYMLEKAMASHSSSLACKVPWMEEPGRLQSMGSLRVGHDWATSLSLFTFVHWRRKWQPTPVLLPGESQGRGSLVGCCLWGRAE